MSKIRFLALVVCAAILMPMLTSCRLSGGTGNGVVRSDDPWYESNRFQIEKKLRKNDEVLSELVCTCDDKFFFVYTASDDRWETSLTHLDTYDYDGNLIKRQEILCPELDNFHIISIYDISTDKEGKTIQAVLWYAAVKENGCIFADIDTETGIVSNIRKLVDKKAEKALNKDYGLFNIESAGDYSVAVYSANGADISYKLLLFKNGEFIDELDLSTVDLVYLLDGLTVDESSGSLYMVGYVKQDIITMVFDLNNGKLKDKISFKNSDDKTINLGEYTVTDNGELCKIDTLGNIIKADINSMTSQTVVDTNWYTPYFYSSTDDDSSISSQVLYCTENKVVIKDYVTKSYGGFEYNHYEYIRVLKKAEKNPNAGKKVIELALPTDSNVSEYLAKAIYEFNRTDNEYVIRIWDKYKTGFIIGRSMGKSEEDSDQQIFKMIQDLKGDQAPDLAVGIQKNYAMRDDVFMDLSDFLDADVKEKQYSNIIEAGRINGKLYFLPVTIQIEGLVTQTDLLKDGAVGITFEEYEKLIKDSMYGYSPYDYTYSASYNKRAFLLSCIDTKRAIEGDKIDFGNEQFRTAAEYAKKNIQYNDFESTPIEYYIDWNRYRGKCYYAKLDSFLEFVHACYTMKDHYTIIGTPSVDAVGPRFTARETISVSAATDVKDGCKKFINYLFAGKAFESDDCEFKQIVTNKEIMNTNIDTLMRLNNETYDRYQASIMSGTIIPAAGLDRVTGDKKASDDMRESFLNSLSTVSIYYYEDYSIVKFIDEELAPYYAGDRSLDDAIKFINDRTTKYVREM